MKKLLTISLFLNVALFCGLLLFWKEPVVRADIKGGGGAEPTCTEVNGDVKGDGLVDIADAILILGYTFLGEPESLIQICPPGDVNCGLAATGQSRCYDSLGNLIPCDTEGYIGQDGDYQTGCSAVDRFVDNGDGTVTDNCTGLMWQQETAPGEYTWQGALEYCENLVLGEGDHDDWRLPNVRELQSIIDYGRNPPIDPVFGALPDFYWSSTSLTLGADSAWGAVFGGGDFSGYVWGGNGNKVRPNLVRAVRDS